MSQLNFLWTQWKIDAEIEKLPSKTPKPWLKPVDLEQASESSENNEDESSDDNKINSKVDTKIEQLPEQRLPHKSNKLYNRIEDNVKLTSKKHLFLNMKQYYESQGKNPYDVLPVTFHIKKGSSDEEFNKFKEFYDNELEKSKDDPTYKNTWIIKPGENSNRGDGIRVSDDIGEIKDMLDEFSSRSNRTCIVQKYINNPLLIDKRKLLIMSKILI